MFSHSEVLGQVLFGTAAAVGHQLGHRLMGWLARVWNSFSRKSLRDVDALVRKVEPRDLKGEIPAGMRLVHYRGDELLATNLSGIPRTLPDGESLWLIPDGTVWLPTQLTCGGEAVDAEIAIQVHPELGLKSLVGDEPLVTPGWLGAFVAGGLLGILNSPDWGDWSRLLDGDHGATEQCLNRVNAALKGRGVSCHGLRNIERPAVASAAVDPVVVQTVAELRTEQDWAHLSEGMASAGIPIDRSAERELAELRNEVLEKRLAPEAAANRLAAMTAAAFERAGIPVSRLGEWQAVATRLRDVEDEAVAPAVPAPLVTGVAKPGRPSTWWVWDRAEVYMRLQRFLRRSVSRCRTGLEQALLTTRDLGQLRRLRELSQQVDHLSELMATLPILTVKTPSLRLDGVQVKDAVRALQTAVTASETLLENVDTFLRTPVADEAWTTAWAESMRSTVLLKQCLDDRRAPL
jgi:hypothetical protein